MAEIAPTIDYLRELKEYLIERFAKQKAQITTTRALRTLAHEVKVPDPYKSTAQVVKTPLLADMVQRVTATLTVNPVTWLRSPLGGSDRAQDVSTLVEKHLAASFRRMEQESGRRTFRMLMSAAVGDGMAVAQLAYKPLAWRPWPKRQQGEGDEDTEDARGYLRRTDEFVKRAAFPFAFLDHDPLSYYVHDGEAEDSTGSEILLLKTLPLKPTIRRLNVYRQGKEWLRGEPGRPLPPGEDYGSNTVEVMEHWTRNYVTYAIDNEIAKQVRHGWGRHGFHHFAGLSSHENSPERSYLPVTFAFEHLIPLLDRLLTMKANWAYLGSFPQPILKLIQQRMQDMAQLLPDGTKNSPPAMELGKLLTLYEGESFDFASPPAVGDDLNQLIQLTMQLIEATGMSPAMKGVSPGADASGYLANQLMTAARLAYDPITDNARFAMDGVGQDFLWMIDKLVKRKVFVWGEAPQGKRQDWLALGPDEIDGYYWVQSQLEPLLPSNLIMEGTFGLQAYQAGAISMKTLRVEYLKLPSPEEEEKQRYIEDFKNSQFMHDALMRRVAEKNGLAQLEEEEKRRQAAEQAAAAGAMGTPPGVPAMPSPEGLLPVTPGQGMPLLPTPPSGMPGPGGPGLPGGNYGQQVVTNEGMG